MCFQLTPPYHFVETKACDQDLQKLLILKVIDIVIAILLKLNKIGKMLVV